ncbi:MAG: xanthine dehydrogenase family protein molybdopterin-binding subunit [Beijerinckiaceae bacterium]|nr:xanthine dehydrogenase family protein molybdopterin-binding subunit [Beijerinckiaceae bacterium]
MKAVNALIGAPIERREDMRFLRGQGIYVGDLTRPDMLHAVVLRSSVAHGHIRRIDATRALALNGVVAVVTGADLAPDVPKIALRLDPLPEFKAFEQPVIAYRKVRYVGEPLALVLAETAAQAEDALDLIDVEIDALPAMLERDDALKGDVLLFEENGTNSPATISGIRGDVEAAFAGAFYTRKERFRVHRHSAVPMETRGLLAEWNPATEVMTVHGAAKVPFHNRAAVAAHLGLSEDQVVMVENDVGGGFGVRGEFYPEDFLVPYAALRFGRPVKWLEDRRENLLATNHAREAECEIEIACDRDATIIGLRAKSTVHVGAYLRTTGSTPARNIAQVIPGPYRIENVRSDVTLLVTNKTPSGTYRGPGRYESDFFRERMLDLAAADFKLDQVEFRRRNLVRESDMPWSMPTVGKVSSETDSGDYETTLDRCLEEFNWPQTSALKGKQIDGRFHGIAVGCYVEGAGSGRESVRIKLESDGAVSVFTGSSAIGQGLETVVAQIAGDALGLPLSAIRPVQHGSTNLVKDGVGSFSSRSVVMGGSALLDAATKLKAEISRAAALRFGCADEDVRLVDGEAVAPDGRVMPFGEFAAGIPPIDGSFSSTKRTYSYGAHAAHVAVDPKTGGVEIVSYVAVEDVGRIINPHTLHGQCVGAIVQGLGGTLLEQFVYDDGGQMVAGSFADYLLPTATDFPHIKVVALELKPSPTNPLGAKGAGEGGIIPVGGVIANAVASALSSYGVMPNELPLSPSRVWAMIEAAQTTA